VNSINCIVCLNGDLERIEPNTYCAFIFYSIIDCGLLRIITMSIWILVLRRSNAYRYGSGRSIADNNNNKKKEVDGYVSDVYRRGGVHIWVTPPKFHQNWYIFYKILFCNFNDILLFYLTCYSIIDIVDMFERCTNIMK
jgi:hypothetical protein